MTNRFYSCAGALCASLLCFLPHAHAADEYDLQFSTFFGGSSWEHARDLVTDSQGNIIIVGGTDSTDFPTLNAFQDTQDKSGTDLNGYVGYCDAFIAKFTPDGQLIWSTYFGGPNYDRAYAVELDPQGNIYVAGRAGKDFPVTPSAFQTDFQINLSSNGNTGFVAKFDPNGQNLWASYVGTNALCREIDVDSNGDIYLPVNYIGNGPTANPNWFIGSYDPTPNGKQDVGVMKVKSDGTQVLWATYFGGNDNDALNAAVQVDSQLNVFLSFTTKSTNLPSTNGTSYSAGSDAFIAKFSNDGKQLLAGTYFGGNGTEAGNSTHSLAISNTDQVVIGSYTNSTDLPVTNGTSLQGANDIFIARFNNNLDLEKCTYFGGSLHDGADGINIDADGNIYVSAQTESTNIPTTQNSYQPNLSPAGAYEHDALLVKWNNDLDQVLYATYMGGPQYDFGRASCLDNQGAWILSGSTNGNGWPTLNAYQDTFAGGNGKNNNGGSYAGDVMIARFTPRDLVSNTPPQINAGPDITGNTEDILALNGTAQDDGLPNDSLTFQWTQVSGPDQLSILQAQSLNASFNAIIAGDYVLRLTVSDGEFAVHDDLAVTITDINSNEPFAHWTFDEGTGTVAQDESQNYDAVLKNGTTWNTGPINGALQFDGINDHARISHNDIFNPNSQSFSLSIWAKRDNLANVNMRLVNKVTNAFYRPTFALGIGIDGTFGSHFYSTDGRWIGASSDTPTTDTEWHLYSVVYDFENDQALFYVDGQLNGQNDLTGARPAHGTGDLFIGSGDHRREYFAGSLDDFRLYKKALDSDEIAALYAQGVPSAPADITPPDFAITFVTLEGTVDGTGSNIQDVVINNQTANLQGNQWSITLPITSDTHYFDVIVTEDSGLQHIESIMIASDLNPNN